MSAEYDVIVLGAGPAGLMAAGFAAEAGASVLVLEKNSEPGRKLCVTGGGRGNLTHAEFDARKLAACFGPASRALLGPFSRFGPAEVLDFFAARGLACKTEADG
ncbi:MAG: FAD-dependent oxidoreductase, partial [Spirochaetaceae bacterium]